MARERFRAITLTIAIALPAIVSASNVACTLFRPFSDPLIPPRTPGDVESAVSRPAVVKGPELAKTARSFQGIIRQNTDLESFPATWQAKSKIRFERVSDAEFRETSGILTRSLAKYLESPLEDSIDAIYVMKRLEFDGNEVQGCVGARTVYFCSGDDVMVFTEAYLERALHYYIACTLFTSHYDWFESSAWDRALPVVFKYLQGDNVNLPYREDRWGVSDASGHSHPPGTVIARGSFESQKFEFAQIASALFTNRPDFWAAVKRSPRLAKKADVVIAFYANLDGNLTLQYFQRLPQVPLTK